MHTTCLRFSAKNSQSLSAKVLSCTQSAKIDTEWLVIMKGIVVTLIWVNDELALNTSCNGLFALLRLLSVSQSRQFLQTDLQITAIKLDIACTALVFYGRVLNRILYSRYCATYRCNTWKCSPRKIFEVQKCLFLHSGSQCFCM